MNYVTRMCASAISFLGVSAWACQDNRLSETTRSGNTSETFLALVDKYDYIYDRLEKKALSKLNARKKTAKKYILTQGTTAPDEKIDMWIDVLLAHTEPLHRNRQQSIQTRLHHSLQQAASQSARAQGMDPEQVHVCVHFSQQ